MQMERDELFKKLVTLQYERNDVNFVRNKFRVHGDTVDIYLAYMSELAIRVEFFGDEIDRITEFNPLTGSKQNVVKHVAIFPASHYIVSAEKKAAALEKIRAECDAQVKQFTAEGKLIEAQLRAYIGRNTALEDNGFYANIYPVDNVVVRAIGILNDTQKND